ncbi:hypothetical protein [Tritonibacter scottomollicae]|uniref:hypothetical protein n=1 Tax=Tritonibacter scottomollicae TaxID=483013 RepID=UPI003AA8F934
MTDYGFGSDGLKKVELKSSRKPVKADELEKAVKTGEELGFVDRAPTKSKPTSSVSAVETSTSGRRRRVSEPQGKVLVTGPERVLQQFRDLCDDRGLPYWKVLEELLGE